LLVRARNGGVDLAKRLSDVSIAARKMEVDGIRVDAMALPGKLVVRHQNVEPGSRRLLGHRHAKRDPRE
jgi:hypothetical protein